MNNSIIFNVKLHKYARTDMYIRVHSSTVNVLISNFLDAAGTAIADLTTLDFQDSELFNLTQTTVVDGSVNYIGNFTSGSADRWLRIKARRYCEFQIELGEKSQIKYLNTPSFFSEWDMSMFATGFTNLKQLFVGGRVTGDTSSLANCSLDRLRISTHTVGVTPSSIGVTKSFSIVPREFDFPKNESLVFNVDNFVTPTNVSNLQYLSIGGVYSVPLRGITGHLQALTALTGLVSLHIRYTSVYPESSTKEVYFNGWDDLTYFKYEHNSSVEPNNN